MQQVPPHRNRLGTKYIYAQHVVVYLRKSLVFVRFIVYSDFAMENTSETPPLDQESNVNGLPEATEDATDGSAEGLEPPKKRRGKPRTDGMPAGSAADPTNRMIPSPRFRDFKPGAANPHQVTQSGCNYWKNLPSWGKDQVVAYVYRTHPVLKLSPADEENEDLAGTNPNIDKLSGVEVIEDEQDMLNRFGCGDYHIRLNDTKRPANAQTVCTIYFKGVGGADYRSAPPTDKRINDIEQVDLTHPANASYLAYLRGAGKLPEQSKKAEAEAEMATIELTKELLKQNERLHEKNTREPAQPAVSPADIVNVARDLAKDMAGANARDPQLTAMLEKLTEAINAKNSGLNLGELVPVLTALMGNRGSADVELQQARAQNMELLMQMLKNEQERTRAEQQRNSELAARLEARIAAPAPATSSITDSVSALRAMREVVEEFSGPKMETNPVEDTARDMAPKWARPFVPYLGPIVQGLATAFLSRMQPQQPGMMPNAGVPAGFPQQPNPQPMQPSLPAPQPEAAPGLDPQITHLLTAISYPLTTRLNEPDPNGEEFAQWFADGYGLQTYQGVIGLGQDEIRKALYAFPPIANAISTIPPGVVQKFVQDFVNAKFEDVAATA